MRIILWLTICSYLIFRGTALDNGLALTPPMGWMSWERFRCMTDCKNRPDECISENLIKKTADLLVSEGYADVGYEYVIIDDCWLTKERSEEGKLQADPERFPNGIKAVADYVHSKGLKFGIYEDYGNKTCAGYPGLIGYLEQDAKMFAEWEVDYLKIDGCNAEVEAMEAGYGEFGRYLNSTGRPIILSCSWPAYFEYEKIEPNFTVLQDTCNLWRNYDDIEDSWASVAHIMDFFAENEYDMSSYAGPGHWNDPDQLVIGNFGLSIEQSRAQMAIWSILASPLLMSTKLDEVRPEMKEILQNEKIIAINQDPLGIQGTRVYVKNNIEFWTKPITPIVGEDYSYAVAVVSRQVSGIPWDISVALEMIGLTREDGYTFENLYTGDTFMLPGKSSLLSVRVPPTGVVFLRAVGLTKPRHYNTVLLK